MPLKDLLNPKNSLYQLADKIPWKEFEKEFSKLYAKDFGRPAKPIRLMISLLILKQLSGLGDETVVEQWVQNPYWQYFSGENIFQWKFPVEPSDLVHFRNRIGENGSQKILEVSIKLFGRDGLEKEAVADTTVQEKNITFPTDVKLCKKIIEQSNMISKKEGMKVRQSYKRTIKKLMMEQRFRNHPKNRKRAMRSERKLKTIAGRLLRELQRNLSSVAYKKYEEKLRVFDRVINQKKDDKNKLYSLHELEVYCISKGKEHKKYEFGSKASIITTKKSGIIIGAMNVKNEYDGHILPSILKQSKELRGVELDKLIVDRGFKGIAKVGSTIIQRPEKPKKSDSQYQKQKKRKDFGRRAAIEPIISHLKTDFLLSRNYLKGSVGDSINLMLSCAAFNYRKFIRRLEFIFAIFRNIIKWNFEVLNLNFKTF
jgi:IS5 family transposase